MARAPTILVCWEMGGGMGHLGHLGLLMRALLSRGCRPLGVFRDLEHVHQLIPPCEILSAPASHTREQLKTTYIYSQLLDNCGFRHDDELRTRVRSWHTIFALTKPDLLVCEHSPTVLLAAHCLGIPACTFGTGFFTPPDVWPPILLLPDGDPEQLQQAETSLRDRLNRILGGFGRPPLARVTELYSRAVESFLTTFAELDHFAESRPNARYSGAWSYTGGAIPEWRSGEGPRIYAYLKPCRLLPSLLSLLSKLPNPLAIYAPEVPGDALRPLVRPNVFLSSRPIGLRRVAEQCDAAVLHGTHGTMSAMFLAGKPCFHIPLYLEQKMLAARLVSQQAAVAIEPSEEAELQSRLSDFLSTNKCASRAAELAEKYRSFDLEREVAYTAQQIHGLAI